MNNRKVRALVLADINETGGTGTYFWRLIEYLLEKYSIHVVFVPGQGSDSCIERLKSKNISYSKDFIIFPKIEEVFMKISRKLGLNLFYFFIRDSLIRIKLEKKYKPDLFMISQGGGYRYFAFLKSKKPLLLIMHSLVEIPITCEFGGALYKNFFSINNLINKRICCVSEYAKNKFIKNIRSPVIATSVIRIWNSVAIRKAEKSKTMHDNITILTLGHLIEYKNPHIWLRVARRIISKYNKFVSFVWAGDGPMLRELKNSVIDIPYIKFIGYTTNVEELYSRADIYFQPSSIENHCLSVIEAMANSLPCVVSNVGGMIESIEDGIEGFVLDPFDEDGYVKVISTLIDDGKKRKEMGIKAKEKAKKLFSYEKWMSDMDKTLSEILKE
jgi:glycosyltransferase involved in cell wall biosynthesis